MRLAKTILFMSLICLPSLTWAKTIDLEQVDFTVGDIFISCNLKDGRSLLVTSSRVELGDRILARQSPVALEGRKGQFLMFTTPHMKLITARELSDQGSRAGIKIEYLDSKFRPAGTVEKLKCSPAST